MRILSASEVEELVEHFAGRRDIWILHESVWIRQIAPGEYAVALKIRNSVPGGLYALTLKPVSWSQQGAEDYVDWLLEKYTAYVLRQEVKRLCAPCVKLPHQAETLSRDLCELQGGPYTRKHGR